MIGLKKKNLGSESSDLLLFAAPPVGYSAYRLITVGGQRQSTDSTTSQVQMQHSVTLDNNGNLEIGGVNF